MVDELTTDERIEFERRYRCCSGIQMAAGLDRVMREGGGVPTHPDQSPRCGRSWTTFGSIAGYRSRSRKWPGRPRICDGRRGCRQGRPEPGRGDCPPTDHAPTCTLKLSVPEGTTISDSSLATLEEVLVAAAGHDRLDRIPVWRDRVAAFGPDAVDAVAPWVGDADLDLFRFANRVIKAVALRGGPERESAIGALMAIGRTEIPEQNRRDLELVLRELEVGKMPRPGGVRARKLNRGEDVLPAGEREATVIHGRIALPDGRPAIRFTVMAQASSSHFGVPIAARAELGLSHADPVYLEVRRTGRFMPTTGTKGEVVFTGETTMRSGPEVYRRLADESTRGLEGIGPNEVIEVLVARPKG